MFFEMKIENDELVKELDRLAKAVPRAIPRAVKAMAQVIRPALVKAAPYDGSAAHKGQHLKEVIKEGTVVKYANGASIVVWLSPRGIPGAKKGPRASKNWDKDKHIYKLVCAEYGKSGQPANPFWEPTVEAKADAAARAAITVMESEMKI